MSNRFLAAAMALSIALTTRIAGAQFAPPGEPVGNLPADAGGESGAGPSIVPPAALPDLSIVPLNTGTAVVTANDALYPVRGNQPLVTNAQLGMISSQPIFALDVFRPIDAQLRAAANSVKTVNDFRTVARALIRNRIEQYKTEIIITAAAEATLTERDFHNIDGYLASERTTLISKHGGSVAAADKALAPLSSVDKAMADRRREVIVELYRAKNISTKIVITRQMLLDAYQRDAKPWHQDAEIELFQLTLFVARWLPTEPTTNGTIGPIIKDLSPAQIKDAEAQAMAAANDWYQKLKTGPGTPQYFAKIVEDAGSRDGAATRGGRTANVKKSSPTDPTKGTLNDPRLEALAFSLPANTLAPPLFLPDQKDPAQSRVVIVKIGEVKPERIIPFTEAQTQLERTLRDSIGQQLWEQHLEKLFQSGAIEAVDRMTEIAVEAAVTRYATSG